MAAWNRPVPFSGTREQRHINVMTHDWVTWDGETECRECCCKPWHTTATYPCGADVPRETINIDWERFDAAVKDTVRDDG